MHMACEGAAMNLRVSDMDDVNVAYWVGHLVSPLALLGTLIGLFPAVTAVVVFVFYCLQIYESRPTQRWLHTRRQRKIAHYTKRIHELEAQIKISKED